MPEWTAFHRRLVLVGPHSLLEWLLWVLLLPLGMLYGLASWLRLLGYRSGVWQRYRAPVPVIGVGNLAVGGTGKTPVVDYLTSGLLAAGYRVAIVSRGYGGNSTRPVTLVSSGSGPLLSAKQCGDEPYLLAQRNPAALVAVGARRRDVVRLVVEELHAEVIVLDDGFQHHAVARDLDLLLLDARQPFTNGWPLPAGLLREFPFAIKRADAVIFTRCDDLSTPVDVGRLPRYHCRYQLAERIRMLSGEDRPFADMVGRNVVAFAGIAGPERFFQQLKAAGVNLLATFAFPDHVDYSDELQQRLIAAADGADFLVTTEKDAVKLPRTFPVPCYQVRLELEFLDQSPPLDRVLKLLKEDRYGAEKRIT
ncbi:MAG: tetraacyldisaccharide 4'-kinase [Desulfuromonadaceae bacterium]|nr:tetraacyldisaccharide 4'-kinase [Desulfuromonadaceae bacterium]